MALADAQVRKGMRTILLEAMQFVENEALPFEYTDSEKGGAFAFLKKGAFGEEPTPTPNSQTIYVIAYVAVIENESVYRERLATLRPLLGE